MRHHHPSDPCPPHDWQASWQPIETAPKDGAYVLLLLSGFVTAPAPFPVVLSSYSITEKFFNGNCVDRQEGWGFQVPFSAYSHTFPTHWMPLPEPPNAKAGAAE